ncbi:MAG TPA: glucodextranase DOMON-like domain-containing protein [Capillibacterium sp.]
MWKYLLLFLGVCLVCSLAGTGAGPAGDRSTAVYFEAADPAGDDYGPGGYIYPQNFAFRPYEGLYDLLRFRVSGNDEALFFDLQIKEITNPWNAPEGFIHPVIHIYLDLAPGGRTEPLYEEMGVRMPPQYGWEVCLEGVGWESSRLVYLGEGGKLETTSLAAAYLPDQHVIRLTVPRARLGSPEKHWRYYVLIGAYDGFGPGFLREVRPEPGDWHFGGAPAGQIVPRVLDLLAPERGKYTQERQLRPGKDGWPVVYPFNRRKELPWGYLVLGGLLLALGYYLSRRLVITGFWFKGAELDKDGLPVEK